MGRGRAVARLQPRNGKDTFRQATELTRRATQRTRLDTLWISKVRKSNGAEQRGMVWRRNGIELRRNSSEPLRAARAWKGLVERRIDGKWRREVKNSSAVE